MSKTNIPVLSDLNLQIKFSEAILEAKSLRMNQPTGWVEKLIRIKHRQSQIWEGIYSGEIDVACWSEEYSTEERELELIELYKQRGFENNFENCIDIEYEIDILDDVVENLLGE